MSQAVGRMVGGRHYLDYAIQPIQFIAANGWDFFAGNVLKYLVRWRDKAGIPDLEKALHYAQLRIELDAELRPAGPVRRFISMNDFVKMNGIAQVDDPPLYALELWVMAGPHSTAIRAQFLTVLESYISDRKAEAAGLLPPV